MRAYLVVCVFAVVLLAVPVSAPTVPRPMPPLTGQATPTILGSYSIAAFAALPGACDFAVRGSPNGSVSYAYIVSGSLFYSWNGSTAAPIRIATTATCMGGYTSGIDLAFKPSGAAVVGWLDVRSGNPALFLASSDTAWANVLGSTGSTLPVRALRVAVDSAGVIHAAYIRDTLATNPYNDGVFASSSPSWAETAVSAGGNAQTLDMAVDSLNHVHVTWYNFADLESVWYANSTSAWANVRVDTNQTQAYWDDRYDPTIAVDAANHAHVVWVDSRTDNVSGTLVNNNESLETASSATGFVNQALVFPGNAEDLRGPFLPSLTIDAAGTWHVTWVALGGWGDLYYANSTDWNTAYRMTDQDWIYGGFSRFPLHPVLVRNGAVSVFFADTRTGTFTIWEKSSWGTLDTTPPVVEPRPDTSVLVNRTVNLRAANAWDDDRIAFWNWSFVGPTSFAASGFWANVSFPAPGTYAVTLTVTDPSGNTGSGSFSITAMYPASRVHWAVDQPLFPIPSSGSFGPNGAVLMDAWQGYFPLVYTGGPYYARLTANGSALAPPVSYSDGWMSAETVDPSGNLYLAGFNGMSDQMEFMALSPTGATRVAPMSLALNGFLPQQPTLAFANGHVWLAWSDQKNSQTEIYLAMLSTAGNVVWGPTQVSLVNVTTWNPMMTLTDGRLWIVYDPTGLPAAASVFNLTTMAFDLRDVSLGMAYAWSIAGLPDGGVAVGWTATAGVYVSFFGASGSAGATTLVNFDDGGSYNVPELAADASGHVHVAWWDQGNWSLYYTDLAPNGTTTPAGGVILRANAPGSSSFVGYESAGVQLGPDGAPRIVYMAYDSGAWELDMAYYDPIPPAARINASATAAAQHPLVLSGNASSDNDRVTAYSWDFGDGSRGTGVWVAHAYSVPGTYTDTLTVADAAGNTNATSTTITVTPSPLADFTALPVVYVGQADLLDGRSSSENGGTIVNYTWTLAGAVSATYYGATVEIRFMTAGSISVTLTVTDAASRTDSVREYITVLPDTTPPTVSAEVHGPLGAGGWYIGNANLSLAAGDGQSGVRTILYSTDGGTWQTYTAPVSFPDGSWAVNYTAVDWAGNAAPNATVVIRVDYTPPILHLDSLPATVTSSAVTVSWAGHDTTSGIARYEVSVDGGTAQSVGTSLSFTTTLADGSHAITVTAVDAAGNHASDSATFTVNTNVFSPSGPYAGAPTYAIVAAAAAVAGYVLWRRRKQTRPPPPESPPRPGTP